MAHPKLALARVNYSQLYGVYDSGKTYRHRDVLSPYHLLTLAGYVQNQGIDVRIFDGEVDLMDELQLAEEIIDWGPDFVGLTATTPDIELSLEACRLVKERNSSIVTIIGGPHANVMGGDVARCEWVDYVVIGDGEEPLVQIIEKEKGRAGAKSIDTKNRPILSKIIRGNRRDLTSQPMPAHNLLDYSKYRFTDPTRGQYNTASIMFSRGCPFDCFFCFHDRHIRYRKIDDFIKEIEYLYRENDVRYYYIYDDTFMVNRSRTLEILKRIMDLGIEDANFQCLTRANLVEPDIIEILRKANFVRVSMGLESGSDEILKIISKGVRCRDYIKACKILADYGIEPRASFILGLPYETHKTINETIDFTKELDLFHANFNIMTPYPGTRVYDMALRGEGIYFEDAQYAREWQAYRRWGKSIIRTDDLSAKDLESYQLKAQVEFYSQDKILDYYQSLFERGNRSRYFYRPLNFAWQKKFGKDVPFWNELLEDEIIMPKTAINI